MKKTKPIFLIIIAILAIVIPLWYQNMIVWFERLPSDFSYEADINSIDNFYDQENANYSGEVQTATKFNFSTQSIQDGLNIIKNTFDVKTPDGKPVITLERVYGIDPVSGKHIPGYGDKERNGYLFAPKHLQKGQSFIYWHINYDAPALMTFAGEEDLLGLHTYRYETHYEGEKIDQTNDLKHLPDVGVTRGVELDPYLQVWIEPTTGRLIKYEDQTIAYYYDLKTGERLFPWNKFHNHFTLASVEKQAELTQSIILQNFLIESVIPIFLAITLFVILGFLIAHNTNFIKKTSYLIPLVVLVTLLIGGYYAGEIGQNFLQKQDVLQFEKDVNDINDAIIDRLNIYANALQGFRGLFDASEIVSREEFNAYANSIRLQLSYPGVQTISYIKVIPKAELAKHVAEVRAGGYPDYQIKDFSGEPAGDRDVYTSIFYSNSTLETVGDVPNAFGYDAYTEPVRHEAMIRARDNNQVAITKKVVLLNTINQEQNIGFNMYVPIYSHNIKITTVEERRNALLGYVYVPFRIEDLMKNIVSSQDYNIDFQIYDGIGNGIETTGNILYDHDKGKYHNETSDFEVKKVVNLFGRSWTIRYKSSPDYGTNTTKMLVLGGIWGGGFILSILISVILFLALNSRADAIRLAEVITKDLQNQKSKLAAEKTKDEAILQSIGDGVVAIDAAGKLQFMNDAAEKMLRINDGNISGKQFIQSIVMFDEGGNKVPPEKRPMRKAALEKKPVTVPAGYTYQRHDGTTFPVALIATPIMMNGKTIGVIEVFRDITHEREVDKVKSEFVSLASHQLRTPLSAISWYTEMLMDGDAGELNDDQKKYLAEISNGNQRMIELVNSLLSVSRLDLGTFTIEPSETNVVDIAKSIVLEMKPMTKEKKLQVSEKYMGKIPLMNVDPKLTRIIFQNLVSNAAKYTQPHGSIEIMMKVVKKGETIDGTKLQSNSLCTIISDNGYGIPKEQQGMIFQKLFRADNVKEHDTEGTGLGMYIVKSIVDASKGRIWFKSELNKGTTFYVILPLEGMKSKRNGKHLTD